VGRRLRHLALLATAGALAWAAAPALSLDPYLPPARDFEQSLPELKRVEAAAAAVRGATPAAAHAGHPGEGPVTHRSPVIDAPHRFDLVGLAGELRPLELRARERGGQWSDWVEAASGDPVYTGGSDQVQLRSRGWRPRGTLHYVNVSGTSSAAEGVLTSFRRSVNTAVVGAASLIETPAAADVARPDLVRRSEWGANQDPGGCPPRATPAYGEVKAAVVHHTVTTNSYSEAVAPSIVLGICRYHRNANGWNDIGYNALVDRFGNLYIGRAGGIGRAVVGAHAAGFNSQTTGIAAIGDHTTIPFTTEGIRAAARFLAWKLSHHGTEAAGKVTLISLGSDKHPAGKKISVWRISGHSRFSYTACPGDGGRSKLPKIRRKAQRQIDESGGAVAG
jgi:hypothetical protein